MGKMINKSLLLTYLYLLIYIVLSSGVILYNKVIYVGPSELCLLESYSKSPLYSNLELQRRPMYLTYASPMQHIYIQQLQNNTLHACNINHFLQEINDYLFLFVILLLNFCWRICLQWVLSPKYFNFPFPITLTMIHMGFSGAVAFFLVRILKVVAPVKMTFEIYSTCVIPISAFFASSLWFGNTAFLHISVAFIQMLKALMPVATFVVAVLCGTDNLRWDVLSNMVLVSVGVVVSSYGEIHFNIVGTVYQVTGIFAEALRLVLTQVLLQKKGLTLNPITSLYYIAPCSFVFLFVPWYFLEKPGMEVSQIQFNFWIFFSNAICALALNYSIFLVIGRTGAVTFRVAGVLKDWILIALSTVVFPESTITGLNIIGYAIALCGVVMYNYLKVKEAHTSQLPTDSVSDRISKNWKLEKKSSDILRPDSSDDYNEGGSMNVDEEIPLIPSSKLSHIGRSQVSSHGT